MPCLSLFRGKLEEDKNGAAPMPKREEEIDKKIDRSVDAERLSLGVALFISFKVGEIYARLV